jgi:hypothetical protein
MKYLKKGKSSVQLTSVNINGAGVRPQTPTVAPPLAGFNMNSLVAYFSIIHT